MKNLFILFLFFTPFGLFAQESVTRSEDGKSLIVQPKKHVAFFNADSVRISTEMFNDSLATLKYFMSSRNVEDTTVFLLTRKFSRNYRECIGEKLPDLEIKDLAGNKLAVGKNKNIS